MPDEILQLLAVHKRLLDFVDLELKQVDIKTHRGFQDTCIYLFAKSTKTYRAIHHMCNNGTGYGEDAIILSRSLLENLINLAYIANPQQEPEREHRAKLFVGWIMIDGQRKIEGLEKTDPIRIQMENNLKTYRPDWDVSKLFQEECDAHRKRGKKPNNWSWSGLKLKDMSEEIGLLDPYYNKVYWSYSQIVHPHPGGSVSYMKYNPDGRILIVDTPNNDWIEESLIISLDCYIRMVGLFNNVFDLKLDDKLKTIDTEASNLIKKL